MPVYRARAHLAAAVDSALSSTVDLELVAVDDGSSDGSSEVLADRAAGDPRVVVIRHAENAGLLTSLNAGLAAARGRYIARLDADDRCLDGRFEAQINAFRDVPELVLCWTDYERIDLSGA
jgi:glycosyltransferase involved in cell wall biosynthesis